MKYGDISGMSEYEQKRARNIERNNARLHNLGLISAREEMELNATAWAEKISPKQSSLKLTPPKVHPNFKKKLDLSSEENEDST
eukprot:8864484-Ditylum_brightwellii.AAC.1